MTRRDERAEIERQLRQVDDYKARKLMRPEEADAQRRALERRLLDTVLPDAPAPTPRPLARLGAIAAMGAVVSFVGAWLLWGDAGLQPRTVAMLRLAARQDAERAQGPTGGSRSASGAPTGTAADARPDPAPTPGSAAPAALPTAAATASGSRPADPHAWVSGRIEIAPPLQRRVDPDDAVFVTLRHPGETGLPLAAVRKRADDLPLDFSLGPKDVVGDVARVTAASAPVVVEVRVSRSGRGLAQPGDLESAAPPAPLGSTGVRVVVQRVVGGGGR